jgi:hypothetical protein
MKLNEIIDPDQHQQIVEYILNSILIPDVYKVYKDVLNDSSNLSFPARTKFTENEILIASKWIVDSLNELSNQQLKPTQAIDMLLELQQYFSR